MSTFDKWWDKLVAWFEKYFKKEEEPVPPASPEPEEPPVVVEDPGTPVARDELPVLLTDVEWRGHNCSMWTLTHAMKATFGGPMDIHLEQSATRDWPTKYDVVGNCWFFIKEAGRWVAFQWDYIRPGQVDRHFPWYPPKHGESYPTVKKGQECYVMISGLCRDNRRNVQSRTACVRAQ